MDSDAPNPTSKGDADALFAEFIKLERAGKAPELEQFCERHPEQAHELRLRHSQWRKAGAALERLKQAGAGPEKRTGEAAEADPEARARAELLWARYKVQGEVGRGGMGYILEVRDRGLDRDLAMKVLRGKGSRPEGMEDGPTRKDERARFLEEARITGRLEHPGIVPVHELGRDPEGKPYFTMKLVAGRTFREILPLAREEREGWNVQRALGVLLKVCEAVGFAHDKGVIHRDLKPANLMVGNFGEVYVMDWGLARDLNRPEPEPKPEHVSSDTDTQDFRTLDGDVIGTPEYMSPEQATGRREEVGPLSDVFAVGAMLYELLCGRAPHGVRGSSSPVMRLAAAIGSNHEPVEEVAPEAPAELCAICERALAPDPDQRYASMVELAEDLRAYLEGRVVRAHATGAWQEARKWVQRNKPLAASLAAAVLLLVVGLVTALYLGEEAQANFELAEQRREEAQDSFELAEKRRAEVARLNEDLEAQTQAARSAAEAERARADEVLRLSALQDFDELMARVDELWPAHPENIAAYEAWLQEAQTLVEDLPLHRAKRDELRASALPQPEAEPEAPLAAAAGGLPGLEAEPAELELQASAPGTWTFPQTEAGREARWWHANVTKLVVALEGLENQATGLLSQAEDAVSGEHGWSVPRRLAFAERLRDGFAAGSEWSDRWDEAIAEIREHPDYGGLELAPQMGLVPIGTDPESDLWEFWHVATGEEPKRGEDGKLVLTEDIGVVLVLIPAGTFWMGASADPSAEHNHDPQAVADEAPVHEVTLSAYFLSKYEMTQGQWSRFAGHNPSYYQLNALTPSLLHPVESVSWIDTMRELPRMGLLLPSEAQWENGCRAGTTSKWWLGDERESLRGKVNIADKTAADAGASWPVIQDWPDNEDGGAVHVQVGFGRYPPNDFGLHEVHGNVWEWCLDGYAPDAYRRSSAVDPVVLEEGAPTHVYRSGSFGNHADKARSAQRSDDPPSSADLVLGVRPARVISE